MATLVPYGLINDNTPPVITPQQQPRNAKAMKGLAITQLVVGVLTLIFGIVGIFAPLDVWIVRSGTGIWCGVWIVVTGIIGVCSTQNLNTCNLNGVYMALSIISTCAAGLGGLFSIIAVKIASEFTCSNNDIYDEYAYPGTSTGYITEPPAYCNNEFALGLGLHIPMLILMALEFLVSIIAAVFAGQIGCGNSRAGIIMQQPPQMTVITTSTGQTQLTSGAYPSCGMQYPGQIAPQYAGQMAPQYNPQMQQPNAMPTNVYSQNPPGHNAPQH